MEGLEHQLEVSIRKLLYRILHLVWQFIFHILH